MNNFTLQYIIMFYTFPTKQKKLPINEFRNDEKIDVIKNVELEVNESIKVKIL